MDPLSTSQVRARIMPIAGLRQGKRREARHPKPHDQVAMSRPLPTISRRRKEIRRNRHNCRRRESFFACGCQGLRNFPRFLPGTSLA